MKKAFIIYFSLVSFSLFARSELVFWNFSSEDNVAERSIEANEDRTIEWTASGQIPEYPQGPSGTGSFSLSLRGWDEGAETKCWMTVINTQGYENICVSSFQYSSGTGPRFFILQYKTNEKDLWNDVLGGDITVGSNWTEGRLNNLSLPFEANNQQTLYLRWVMENNIGVTSMTVQPGGTSRIANVSIEGDEIENSSIEDWFEY